MNKDNLKIAVQKTGRLNEKSVQLLSKIGLKFEINERKLISECQNFPLDILFIRDDNIPEYVAQGIADLGIVGEDILREQSAEVITIKRLNFAECTLKIACPIKNQIKNLAGLQNKKIATSYPNCLRKFLDENNIQAKIVALSGSVEIAPSLGVADCICDIVSTGSTLKTNGLVPIFDVFESRAALIANSNFNINKLIKTYDSRKNCYANN